MVPKMKTRSYYTRPTYTSASAARLRRSRMRPWRSGLWMAGVYFPMKIRQRTKLNRVIWLVSLHTARKRLFDKQRAQQSPNHLIHRRDIEVLRGDGSQG